MGWGSRRHQSACACQAGEAAEGQVLLFPVFSCSTQGQSILECLFLLTSCPCQMSACRLPLLGGCWLVCLPGCGQGRGKADAGMPAVCLFAHWDSAATPFGGRVVFAFSQSFLLPPVWDRWMEGWDGQFSTTLSSPLSQGGVTSPAMRRPTCLFCLSVMSCRFLSALIGGRIDMGGRTCSLRRVHRSEEKVAEKGRFCLVVEPKSGA